MVTYYQQRNANNDIRDAVASSAAACSLGILPWTDSGTLILIRKSMIKNIFKCLGRYVDSDEIDIIYDAIIDKVKNYRTDGCVASTLLKFIPVVGTFTRGFIGCDADVDITSHMGYAIKNAFLSVSYVNCTAEDLIYEIRQKL
jgi:uncharacterized protein (DUF697 family)